MAVSIEEEHFNNSRHLYDRSTETLFRAALSNQPYGPPLIIDGTKERKRGATVTNLRNNRVSKEIYCQAISSAPLGRHYQRHPSSLDREIVISSGPYGTHVDVPTGPTPT
ncbi:hypothetical protein WA026_013946, partial [Henosepilachna vigintioctopunctata]